MKGSQTGRGFRASPSPSIFDFNLLHNVWIQIQGFADCNLAWPVALQREGKPGSRKRYFAPGFRWGALTSSVHSWWNVPLLTRAPWTPRFQRSLRIMWGDNLNCGFWMLTVPFCLGKDLVISERQLACEKVDASLMDFLLFFFLMKIEPRALYVLA